MKAVPAMRLNALRPRTVVEAKALGWGVVRAWPEALAAWRKAPAPRPSDDYTPSQLKNADDQSVAALWAVCEARESLGREAASFADWAVVAAPTFFGRVANAQAIDRFRAEGAWGISPHMIPQHSLHAISATVSQQLSIRGPNFGVGNGHGSAVEGWLAAATLLSEPNATGVWLVFTGYDGELLPTRDGQPASRRELAAIALALVPATDDASGLCVRVAAERGDDAFLQAMPLVSLPSMAEELARHDATIAAMWRLPGVGWVEIEAR